MRKKLLFMVIIFVQIVLVSMFFKMRSMNDVIVNKYVSIVHNNNLDKIATSVSVLFRNEDVSHVVMVDDSILQDMPTTYITKPDEEVNNENVSDSDELSKSTPLYLIDSSKYKNNKAMGFVVTDNNKTYELNDKEFDVVVAVVAGEYDRNLNDALAVMSVILNRCDSKSWSSWAGNSPYDQVVMKGQFEVYFEGYYLDYMPGGNKYGKEKYEVAKQAVLDGLNGIRNNKYLGFRAWWVSEYSDKYIVTGGNRYGYN